MTTALKVLQEAMTGRKADINRDVYVMATALRGPDMSGSVSKALKTRFTVPIRAAVGVAHFGFPSSVKNDISDVSYWRELRWEILRLQAAQNPNDHGVTVEECFEAARRLDCIQGMGYPGVDKPTRDPSCPYNPQVWQKIQAQLQPFWHYLEHCRTAIDCVIHSIQEAQLQAKLAEERAKEEAHADLQSASPVGQ